MAANTALTVQIRADLSSFQKGLDKATEAAKKAGEKMKAVGKSMSTFVTLPIIAAGGAAVANAVKFEKLATSLNVLAGGAEKGAEAFEKIKKFSAATPFQLDELVGVNNTLMGFGQSTDQAFDSLKRLADMAAISGSDLNRLAVAYGQSAAVGRVMTMDLTQFVNNGVPVYKLLGDITGKTAGELRHMAETGQISFELLEQAFKKATDEGGLFFQGTAKLSQTLGGRLSTLRDNFSLMMGEIGQLIGEYLSPLMATATKLFQSFSKLSDGAKRTIVIVGGLVAAIGPLLIVLGTLGTLLPGIATAFAVMTSPITLIIGGIAALAASIIYLADNWEAVKDRITDISWWKNALIDMVQFFIKINPFSLIIDGINKVASWLGRDEITNPFDTLRGKLEELKVPVEDNKKEFGSFSDALVNAAKWAGIMSEEADKAKTSITNLGNSTGGAANKINTATGNNKSGQEGRGINSGVSQANLGQETLKLADDVIEANKAIEASAESMTRATIDGVGQMISGFRMLAGDSKALALFEIAVNTARGIAAAVQAGAGIPFPANLGAIASGVGAVLSGIGSAKQALSQAPAFATGGIVGGASTSGDRVMARVNSGEMILNRGQQANLFGMINRGGDGGGRLVTQIAGNDLRVILERANNTNNRLR